MNTARASRLEPTRRALIFWTLFQDLAFSGAALLIVNGLTNLTAAELLLARGRYGLHRWEMPIEPLAVDLSAYAQVTICPPIWVFSLAAPVRSFCRQAAREMDALLGLTRTRLVSRQCRLGVYR